MAPMLLMIQAVSENIALFCCALFTGGSVYISLVEHPATRAGGASLASTYFVVAHPRPAVLLALFASLAALAGLLNAFAGGGAAWAIGGIVLGASAVVHLAMVLPATRQLSEIDPDARPDEAGALLARLSRLHAGLSLASLGALSAFIMHG